MVGIAEQELRAQFDRWFAEAASKDLDAVMSHMACAIVSYEHDAPLQYDDLDAIREVCRRGFQAMEGDFRWDIPDLHVVVRDDLAVTWGLNRMRVVAPDGSRMENWSRGTRVFQRIGSRWQVIHQHVSYPYDPETGEAKTDLIP